MTPPGVAPSLCRYRGWAPRLATRRLRWRQAERASPQRLPRVRMAQCAAWAQEARCEPPHLRRTRRGPAPAGDGPARRARRDLARQLQRVRPWSSEWRATLRRTPYSSSIFERQRQPTARKSCRSPHCDARVLRARLSPARRGAVPSVGVHRPLTPCFARRRKPTKRPEQDTINGRKSPHSAPPSHASAGAWPRSACGERGGHRGVSPSQPSILGNARGRLIPSHGRPTPPSV